jgi:hypothetical protein
MACVVLETMSLSSATAGSAASPPLKRSVVTATPTVLNDGARNLSSMFLGILGKAKKPELADRRQLEITS